MQAITCAQTAYLSHLLTTRSAKLYHTSALQHKQLSANFAVYVKRQSQISFAIPISRISLVICILCPDTTTRLFAYSEQIQLILFGHILIRCNYTPICIFREDAGAGAWPFVGIMVDVKGALFFTRILKYGHLPLTHRSLPSSPFLNLTISN